MKKMLDKLSKSIMYTLGFTLFITITLADDFKLNKTDAKVDDRVTITESMTEDTIDDYKEIRVQILKPSYIPVKPLTERDIINTYVRDIASKYNLEPELIMSIIQQESEYNPNARNGNCLGLMQVSERWHRDRANRLGVTNFYDPYGNILLGVDYISELYSQYKDMKLVLMLYNMEHKTAISMYRNGKISSYAITVLERAEEYKKGV